MKIILSGGGTLGPVIPLLAVVEAYKQHDPQAVYIWVGTKAGPERQVVEEAGLRFLTIGAGKWRRYFSLLNLFDLFKIIIAFFQSLVILLREKPDLLISCGGFVSVPLHIAGAFLRIPSWVHQQDVKVGLANKLMFPFAKKITTALEVTRQSIAIKKSEWIGNPVRDLVVSNLPLARQKCNIPENTPVILALGGGTGSNSINKLVLEALPQWPREWHVIHLVGKDRPAELSQKAATVFPNYHVYTFLTSEMKDALALADVVIARAGFGTLSELAALQKAAIILPMEGSHQEANAEFFAQAGGIIILKHTTSSALELAQTVKELLENKLQQTSLGERLHELLPQAKPAKIISIIQSLV